ncbi:hypothetical protein GGH94_003929 [Coemansia aciculifera]|uniref:A-kinase anchor protein 7-like phosphoesterase domain-containing protein n=1 Tax=Coemansia aciculifera TaxID=417176 RepID=A0A9W8IGF9_9FUNG|nr:hypothetical protein GGH94_003929 [Coemansia aciculifera]KAJ2870646.1 hypothetical protein GGH93_005415 [Coemansia aciculifera]
MASACTLVPNPVKLAGRALKIMQPNYILAIRLSDKNLQQELANFHDHVHRDHQKYRKYLVKPERMHIHIASMHLGTQASLDAASGVLQCCNDLVEKYLTTNPVLRFKGLKLYDTGASVTTNICDVPTELTSLVRELRLQFWSLGYVAKASEMPPRIPFFEDNVIPSGGEFTLSDGKVSVWNPRITLMKLHGADLSRKKREATASFKSAMKHNNGVVFEDGIARKLTLNDFFGIPASVIQRFENHDLGSQTVDRLDLLSLVNNTGHVRGYPSYKHLDFNL